MALILVADDEYFLAVMLADMLEDEGHEVQTAPNGQAALALMRDAKPALLITDFMMPIMTGLELAEAMHEDAALADIPIILVSGAQGGIAREKPELFQAVFDKPYQRDGLLAEVERMLNGKG
ncbi:response regulator [Novosphingobium rosa]|uniref:response regulator n=1 Tax=Novosphingobium rosa TaxID=76978 RepID=UPI000836D579|nr:response regulator [Novosphingobium rosa]